MASPKELYVRYSIDYHPLDFLTQIINRTFPTNRGEVTDIAIIVNEGCDIKHLLQSLTIKPFSSTTILIEKDIDSDESSDMETDFGDSTDVESNSGESTITESNSGESMDSEIDVGEDLKIFCESNGLGKLHVRPY
ncbi:uncharacterized protein LOC135213182 [Macrobrachium nipponense]|uniref:uncharacterized protein LOC135213182 n=1 Tax=Macrobrachium nipponense TaxID=159736 RepID=UPI0030C7F9E0